MPLSDAEPDSTLFPFYRDDLSGPHFLGRAPKFVYFFHSKLVWMGNPRMRCEQMDGPRNSGKKDLFPKHRGKGLGGTKSGACAATNPPPPI